jgi:predicted hydrocarbon binding protein
MSQSVTISPDATVSGGNILSMLAAMGPFRRRGEAVLQERGIGEVSPEGWYPLPVYVTALREIGERMGPNTLYQIGRQIVNHVALPPEIDSFEKVLASFGQAFDLNHRGVAPGAISYRMTSDRSASITTATPYPCGFDRGVIHGFFQKLLGLRVTVEHADGACKNQGAPCCTHLVVVPVI